MAFVKKRSGNGGSGLMSLKGQLDDLLSIGGSRETRQASAQQARSHDWIPEVDIYESNDEIVVECECPGLSKKDIDIRVEGNRLTIGGTRQSFSEEKDRNYYRTERSIGSFERSFTLPAGIEKEQVKASFKQGVLRVLLPKSEEERSHRVEISG